MKRSQRLIGLGGAVIGIGVGLWGATRPTTGAREITSSDLDVRNHHIA